MGLEPEHPRAGSNDDVEGIFAILHGMLGSIFDEKAFHDAFPKVINEYTKQCEILIYHSIIILVRMIDLMMVRWPHLTFPSLVAWNSLIECAYQQERILGFLLQIEQ